MTDTRNRWTEIKHWPPPLWFRLPVYVAVIYLAVVYIGVPSHRAYMKEKMDKIARAKRYYEYRIFTLSRVTTVIGLASNPDRTGALLSSSLILSEAPEEP